ncbi:MAG: citrate synthase/methylcitrate synthase, partial [Candidatus Thermoplasmatota archaeon]|nr:citrate synthase/methylcitrate synthase [Candidatus Thermoplasmatota archaeon]
RGLEGVVAAETKIGYVDGINGVLAYRGYDIETLTNQSNYEEVSYLLLFGKLPSEKEYREYVSRLKKEMYIEDDVYELIKKVSKESHPMSSLRTVVSYIGGKDSTSVEPDVDQQKEIGIKLIAKMPTIVAAIKRSGSGENFIKPDPELSYAANFFYQSAGRKPDTVEAKMLDTALILHADHGMNASTFSAMLTISTLSDMYSAVTAAISTLKGPLHGGANERALALIQEIGSPDRAEKILAAKMEKKEKIMGFGHRVYKVYDPRAKILKGYAEYVTKKNGQENLFRTATKIEELMVNKLGEKGIFPNVDFYSGILYYSIGFPTNVFTPIFAVGRISGWVARSYEYVQNNRIFRPRSKYTGEKAPRRYVPINERN